MKLAIIIPAYNEGDSILRTIDELRALKERLPAFEILVVDDGSTDGTAQLAELHGVKVVRHAANLGYGRAVRTGLEQAQADIVVTYDADGLYDPGAIPKLVQPILDGSADIVVGSRFGEGRGAETAYSTFGNRLLTASLNLLFKTRLSDALSSLRAIRRESLSRIHCEETGFLFLVECLAKAKVQGLRIQEVPVEARSRFAMYRSLRRSLYGLKVLLAIMRLRWSIPKPL